MTFSFKVYFTSCFHCSFLRCPPGLILAKSHPAPDTCRQMRPLPCVPASLLKTGMARKHCVCFCFVWGQRLRREPKVSPVLQPRTHCSFWVLTRIRRNMTPKTGGSDGGGTDRHEGWYQDPRMTKSTGREGNLSYTEFNILIFMSAWNKDAFFFQTFPLRTQCLDIKVLVCPPDLSSARGWEFRGEHGLTFLTLRRRPKLSTRQIHLLSPETRGRFWSMSIFKRGSKEPNRKNCGRRQWQLGPNKSPFEKGYSEDYNSDFGGTKVIGSGRNHMWNSLHSNVLTLKRNKPGMAGNVLTS